MPNIDQSTLTLLDSTVTVTFRPALNACQEATVLYVATFITPKSLTAFLKTLEKLWTVQSIIAASSQEKPPATSGQMHSKASAC